LTDIKWLKPENIDYELKEKTEIIWYDKSVNLS